MRGALGESYVARQKNVILNFKERGRWRPRSGSIKLWAPDCQEVRAPHGTSSLRHPDAVKGLGRAWGHRVGNAEVSSRESARREDGPLDRRGREICGGQEVILRTGLAICAAHDDVCSRKGDVRNDRLWHNATGNNV